MASSLNFAGSTFAGCALALAAFACGSNADNPFPEQVGFVVPELRKGSPGARIGHSNYCDDPLHPCAIGEGDCDYATQCEADLVCGRNKLNQYADAGGDACVPAHCTNKRRDVDESQIDCGGSCGPRCSPPVCRLNGPNRCTSDCLCGIGEGDCDSSEDCLPNLVCGASRLAQFGDVRGDACVPAHCTNERRDAGETQIDCGGECGQAACTHRGCADVGATYDISVQAIMREKWPASPDDWGVCTSYVTTRHRTLHAVVSAGVVDVQGEGFDGSYPIIEETTRGFVAQAGSLHFPGFMCGDGFREGTNYGLVTLSFRCSTGTMTFSATCTTDVDADGCYPNFEERGTGTGTRSASGAFVATTDESEG